MSIAAPKTQTPRPLKKPEPPLSQHRLEMLLTLMLTTNDILCVFQILSSSFLINVVVFLCFCFCLRYKCC
ncbi:hypothetical protein HanRHA438_Chr11g0531581 [Helianthus annuus]|nr:hypothetical protein HanIR_Chr11g0560031 [Helianthus annuus]KAJ0873143.1 hypothetical protein HanRHA438_Chr11g0531581 [Helianthus annuus]